uniref:Uncharacterized protein n=1 Tax=Daphnia magna TaxID=35525 RepID=A0A0P5Z3H2_9CRUS
MIISPLYDSGCLYDKIVNFIIRYWSNCVLENICCWKVTIYRFPTGSMLKVSVSNQHHNVCQSPIEKYLFLLSV